jgi:hypothetical protein
MGEYRVFTVDRDAHLVSYRKFTCKDDSEAIVWAKHLLDTSPVELWNGDRPVIRLEPASGAQTRV